MKNIKTNRHEFPVWGKPLDNAVQQLDNCLNDSRVYGGALMADHHLGYAMPVGGVIAYRGAISPSAVGFDISCGNKAVFTDASYDYVKGNISEIMDEIYNKISFGVGMKNKESVDHDLFYDDPAWDIPIVSDLKDLARSQLGTIGSGNHYVDLFVDDGGRIVVGVHFGSRGLGHKIASHYIKEGGGKDGIHVDPVVLDENSTLGKEYIAAMQLAGRYAYAGRDWVCSRVATILGENIYDEVHNNHNFAWKENHGGENVWVVRKGATPAFPDQLGFIGGSMGEDSVIIRGVESEESKAALYSTVHGAGRVMSRTEAAGKCKWIKGVKTRVASGKVSQEMMDQWVIDDAQVELRGGGLDESPHCYKRLDEVLEAHSKSIEIVTRLKPIGVAMAGGAVKDPYKD